MHPPSLRAPSLHLHPSPLPLAPIHPIATGYPSYHFRCQQHLHYHAQTQMIHRQAQQPSQAPPQSAFLFDPDEGSDSASRRCFCPCLDCPHRPKVSHPGVPLLSSRPLPSMQHPRLVPWSQSQHQKHQQHHVLHLHPYPYYSTGSTCTLSRNRSREPEGTWQSPYHRPREMTHLGLDVQL